MQIPFEEYYQLMSHLMRYSHNLVELYPDITFEEDIHESLPPEEIFKLRSAIYDDPQLITTYVNKNPDQLSDEHLAIIDSWRFAIKGQFYIERYLKDYAIFLHEGKVYAVRGLFDSFDEFFPKSALPACITTVLLPFKGGTIYDGQMQGYNIHFGGGIKQNLKNEYMTAKRKNEIIHSFDPVHNATHITQTVSAPHKDWSSELEQLKAITKKMKGGAGQPETYGAVFCLLRASIELAELTTSGERDITALRKGISKANRAITRLWNNA